MAITVSGSNEPKFTRTYAEPATEEDKARYESVRAWIKTARSKTGKDHWGQPVPEEVIVKAVRITKGKTLHAWNNYVHCGGGGDGMCVSQAFRDAVEAIEPSVHQFVPFDVLNKDGTRYSDNFYFFKAYNMIDAINPELGGVKKSPGFHYDKGNPDDYRWNFVSGARDKLAVYSDRIAGRAAWRDRRLPTELFFSDTLVGRLKAENLEGWRAVNYWQEI